MCIKFGIVITIPGTVQTTGAFDFKQRCTERSVYDVTVPRDQVVPMLSNGSRGTVTSYTDRSAQRRLKSNAPIVPCPVPIT